MNISDKMKRNLNRILSCLLVIATLATSIQIQPVYATEVPGMTIPESQDTDSSSGNGRNSDVLVAIGDMFSGTSSGDVSDGNVSNGDVPDGDVSNGDVSTGDVSNGDVSTGDVSNGDVSTGDVSNGDVSNGDVSTGDVSNGDMTADKYLGELILSDYFTDEVTVKINDIDTCNAEEINSGEEIRMTLDWSVCLFDVMEESGIVAMNYPLPQGISWQVPNVVLKTGSYLVKDDILTIYAKSTQSGVIANDSIEIIGTAQVDAKKADAGEIAFPDNTFYSIYDKDDILSQVEKEWAAKGLLPYENYFYGEASASNNWLFDRELVNFYNLYKDIPESDYENYEESEVQKIRKIKAAVNGELGDFGDDVYFMYTSDIASIIDMATKGLDLDKFFYGNDLYGITLDDLYFAQEKDLSFDELLVIKKVSLTTGGVSILELGDPNKVESMYKMQTGALGTIPAFGSKAHGPLWKINTTKGSAFCAKYGGSLRTNDQLVEVSPETVLVTNVAQKDAAIKAAIEWYYLVGQSDDAYILSQCIIWYTLNNGALSTDRNSAAYSNMWNSLSQALRNTLHFDNAQIIACEQGLANWAEYYHHYLDRNYEIPYHAEITLHYWDHVGGSGKQPLITWESSQIEKYGRIFFAKVDENGNYLPGCTFIVLDSNFNSFGPGSFETTDEIYIINKVPLGTYYIKEVSAPEGYQIDTTMKSVTVTEAESDSDGVTVKFINKKLPPRVECRKVEAGTNTYVTGTGEFQILKDNASKDVVMTIFLGPGPISVYLEPGKYILHEVKAPDGYLLADDVKFEVTGDYFSQNSVTMEDEHTKYQFAKLDAETGLPLAGAELKLYETDGKKHYNPSTDIPVETWISTTDYKVIERLKIGREYVLVESLAPAGYALAEPVFFTVQNTSQTITIKMSDSKQKFSVWKIDAATGEGLAGAHLQLWDIDEDNNPTVLIDDWISTTVPHVISGIVAKSYLLREVEAPEGYTNFGDQIITFGHIHSTSCYAMGLVRFSDYAESETENKVPSNRTVPGVSDVAELSNMTASATYTAKNTSDSQGDPCRNFTSTYKIKVSPGEKIYYRASLNQDGNNNYGSNSGKNLRPEGCSYQAYYLPDPDDSTNKTIIGTSHTLKAGNGYDGVSGIGRDIEGVYDVDEDEEGNIINRTRIRTEYTNYYTIVSDSNATRYLWKYIELPSDSNDALKNKALSATVRTQTVSYANNRANFNKNQYVSTNNNIAGNNLPISYSTMGGHGVGENGSLRYTYDESYGTEYGVHFPEQFKKISWHYDTYNNSTDSGNDWWNNDRYIIYDEIVVPEDIPTDEIYIEITSDMFHTTHTVNGDKEILPNSNRELRNSISIYRDAKELICGLEEGASQDVVVDNTTTVDKPHITIRKLGAGKYTSWSDIVGAKLELRKDSINGPVYESWTSDGTPHYIQDIPAGTYVLVETEAPEGYTVADPVTIEVEDTTTLQSFKMEDYETLIRVAKVDAETGSPVAGAYLEIWNADANGNAVSLYKRIVSGLTPYELPRIPLGKYILRETKAPQGYRLADPIVFDVTNQSIDVEIVMEDNLTELQVSKVDITTSNELPGASMEIWTTKNNDGVTKDTIYEAWVSTETAHIIKGIPVGKYILVEDCAPKGYLVANSIPFEITSDNIVHSVTMEDECTDVTVDKTDIHTGESLAGATLLLYDTKLVQGYYIPNHLIEEWISDGTPHSIKGLNPGTYIITEKEAPTGYSRIGNKIIYVLAKSEKQNFVVEDDYACMPFTLKKVDGDTGEVIESNAVFELYEWSEALGDYQLSPNFKIIRLPDKTYSVTRLATSPYYGWDKWEDGNLYWTPDNQGKFYYVEKSAPEGYITDGNPVFINILDSELVNNLDGVYKAHNKQPSFYAINDATVFANQITRTVLTKSDLVTGELIDGATLQVLKIIGTNTDGSYKTSLIEEWISDKTEVHYFYNKNGNYIEIASESDLPAGETLIIKKGHLIKGLNPGTSYILRERKAPKGYVTAEDIVFTVIGTDENGVIVDVQTVDMYDDITKITISKHDVSMKKIKDPSKLKELPGAYLEIWTVDANKNKLDLVDSWVTTTEPHYIERLPVGNYVLIETKAPDGYLIAGKVYFTVKDTGEVQVVRMYDRKTPEETEEDEEKGLLLLSVSGGNWWNNVITEDNGLEGYSIKLAPLTNLKLAIYGLIMLCAAGLIFFSRRKKKEVNRNE